MNPEFCGMVGVECKVLRCSHCVWNRDFIKEILGSK